MILKNLRSKLTRPRSKPFLKDKRPLLALAAVLCLGGIGMTLAFYSDTTVIQDLTKTSKFGVRTRHESSGYLITLKPGDTFEKLYTTTNLGNTDMAVKYQYMAQWVGADGEPLPLALTLYDEEAGTVDTVMGVDFAINPKRLNDDMYSFPYWDTGSAVTTYCADKVVVTDPDNFVCTNETKDPTQAYSVISGPYYYYKALYPNETTAANLFTSFKHDNRFGETASITTKFCVFDNEEQKAENCAEGVDEETGEPLGFWSVRSGHYDYPTRNLFSTNTMHSFIADHDVMYNNVYADGIYNLTVTVDTVEYSHVAELWGEEVNIFQASYGH